MFNIKKLSSLSILKRLIFSIIFFFLFFVIIFLFVNTRYKLNIEINQRTYQNNQFNLYYDTGKGYNEIEKIGFDVKTNDFEKLRFVINGNKSLISLKFNPVLIDNTVELKEIELSYRIFKIKILSKMFTVKEIETLISNSYQITDKYIDNGKLILQCSRNTSHFSMNIVYANYQKDIKRFLTVACLIISLILSIFIFIFFKSIILIIVKDINHLSFIYKKFIDNLDNYSKLILIILIISFVLFSSMLLINRLYPPQIIINLNVPIKLDSFQIMYDAGDGFNLVDSKFIKSEGIKIKYLLPCKKVEGIKLGFGNRVKAFSIKNIEVKSLVKTISLEKNDFTIPKFTDRFPNLVIISNNLFYNTTGTNSFLVLSNSKILKEINFCILFYQIMILLIITLMVIIITCFLLLLKTKLLQNAVIFILSHKSYILFKKILIKINIFNIFKTEKIFLFSGIIFGFLFLSILPPMMAPDEPVHFYRAYQVSQFDFFKTNGIPSEIVKFADSYMILLKNKDLRININEIISNLNNRIDKKNLTNNSDLYTSLIIPYIPQAIGIYLGNLFNAPPILLSFLGRLMNLIFSVIILYYAIKIYPFNKLPVLLLCLMPMTIQQISSLSYDGLTISLSFLCISLFIKLIFDKDFLLSKKLLALMLFLIILLSMCKPGYGFISVLTILIPRYKFKSLKNKLIFLGIILLITIYPKIFPELSSLIFHPINNSVNIKNETTNIIVVSEPDKQKEFILNHPLLYLKALFSSYFYYFEYSFIGRLGWLDTTLSKDYINIYFYVLFFLTIFLNNKLICKISILNRTFFIMVYLSITIILMTGIYVYWTSSFYVGDPLIEGWQGRYLLPIIMLVIVSIGLNKKIVFEVIENSIQIIAQFLLIFTIIYILNVLLNRYYL